MYWVVFAALNMLSARSTLQRRTTALRLPATQRSTDRFFMRRAGHLFIDSCLRLLWLVFKVFFIGKHEIASVYSSFFY